MAMKWDVVDQASLESFPASDPPGWGSYRIAASAETTGLPHRRTRAQRALRFVAQETGLAMSTMIIALTFAGLTLLAASALGRVLRRSSDAHVRAS